MYCAWCFIIKVVVIFVYGPYPWPGGHHSPYLIDPIKFSNFWPKVQNCKDWWILVNLLKVYKLFILTKMIFSPQKIPPPPFFLAAKICGINTFSIISHKNAYIHWNTYLWRFFFFGMSIWVFWANKSDELKRLHANPYTRGIEYILLCFIQKS